MKVHEHPMRVEYETGSDFATEFIVERAWLWLHENARRGRRMTMFLTQEGNAAFLAPGIVAPVGYVEVGTYTSAVLLPSLREDVFFAAKQIPALCDQEEADASQP